MVWLGWAGSLATGCNFTPLPEPPAAHGIELSRVDVTIEQPGELRLTGAPGAVSDGPARIWAVSHGGMIAPAEWATTADGSFAFSVPGDDGDTLRLQVRVGATERDPVDVVAVSGDVLHAAPRPDCLDAPLVFANPGAVPSGNAATMDIVIDNGCGSAVSLDAANMRTMPSPFTVAASLPTTIAAGDQLAVQIRFLAGPPLSTAEDLLLLDVSGAASARLAVTLSAKVQ